MGLAAAPETRASIADHPQLARIVDIIGRVLLAGTLLVVVVDVATANWSSAVILLGSMAGTAAALALNRRGRVQAAVHLMVVIVQAGAICLVVFGRLGVHDISMMIFPATLVVTSLLLDRRLFVWTAAGTVLAVVALGVAELRGWIVTPFRGLTNAGTVIDASTVVVLTAIAVGLVADSVKKSLLRSREQEASLAAANAALEERATAIAESEERFRSLVELAVDAILLVDEQERIVGANRRASELTGDPPEQLVGRGLGEILVSEDGSAAALLTRLPDDGTPRTAERLLLTRGGGSVPVEIHSKRMPDGTAQLFLRDTTERRRAEAERARLEAELRQSQKMEAVGRVAGGMAHDFNNVLMIVRSCVSMAQRDAEAGSRIARCLSEIDQASERAAALTSRLLAFSRKREIVPRRIDLGDLLCGLQPMMARLLGGRVRLEISRPAEPVAIEADAVQTEHLLLNLALNARDAMPEGGTFAIELRAIELDAAAARAEGVPAGRYAALSAADSGCGMPESVREHVFEPFFTTKEHGTGLGLALVYGAVRQSNGSIRVDSRPGAGATFHILIPRAEP